MGITVVNKNFELNPDDADYEERLDGLLGASEKQIPTCESPKILMEINV